MKQLDAINKKNPDMREKIQGMCVGSSFAMNSQTLDDQSLVAELSSELALTVQWG